jgi:hypothetical protein
MPTFEWTRHGRDTDSSSAGGYGSFAGLIASIGPWQQTLQARKQRLVGHGNFPKEDRRSVDQRLTVLYPLSYGALH